MSLPTYLHIHLKTTSLDEITSVLTSHFNFKQPVVIHIKQFETGAQRELIGLIENYFFTQNMSYKFPYPIYLLTSHEATITRMPTVKDVKYLPKFFSQKEAKMNVKEIQLMGKNKLLQQEIINCDPQANQYEVYAFGINHRKTFEQEIERTFYRSILNRLTKVKKHG